MLAHDMLRAGFAKVYVPDAAVIHSHEYSPLGWLRRSFDEARAMREVYGWAQPADPRPLALALRGSVGGDWRWASARGSTAPRRGSRRRGQSPCCRAHPCTTAPGWPGRCWAAAPTGSRRRSSACSRRSADV